MEFAHFVDLLKTLGVPVAFAAILIWHFLHMNHSLQAHNAKLLSELERVRSQIDTIVQQDHQSLRLLQQNESLAKIVEAKDRESQGLLKLLIEAQIQRGGDVAPKEASPNV